MRHLVWVFSESKAFEAVIDSGEMLFRDHAGSKMSAMSAGDKVVLYTTRAAFHSPNRDNSRLVGLATVLASPSRTRRTLLGETFPWMVPFETTRLLPRRRGPSVRNLVPKLQFVTAKHAWGGFFRPSPVAISAEDYDILRRAVDDWKADELDSIRS